nr:NADH dehydrogenase [ubiquinone] 1 beta subcomplex subunit 9 [Megalopta genalis]
MAQLPSGLITHSQRVCRLYKRILRILDDANMFKHEFRYQAVLIRQRFDENKNIKDVRLAKKLLLEGEEEAFQNEHYQPKKFPDSEGGIVKNNYILLPDYFLDYWHPMEKARYPKYFAKREEMKKEYEKFYYKMYPEDKPTKK